MANKKQKPTGETKRVCLSVRAATWHKLAEEAERMTSGEIAPLAASILDHYASGEFVKSLYLYQHYRGRATEADAKEYFNITP